MKYVNKTFYAEKYQTNHKSLSTRKFFTLIIFNVKISRSMVSESSLIRTPKIVMFCCAFILCFYIQVSLIEHLSYQNTLWS